MQITGERTVPGIPHENYWFRRHQVVYEYVAQQLSPTPRRVLEAGCGEGYGADLLRRRGHRVTALDYDAYAVGHVRATYADVALVRGNLVFLPFADDAFDVVVSLQTIEHLWDQPRFIEECRRVMAPGGRVLLSTPNRLTFPPGNIFHTRELDPAEFRTLATKNDVHPTVFGVHHGQRIREWEERHGSLVAAQITSPPHEWNKRLAAFVMSVTTADFEMVEADLEHCLDLVARIEDRSRMRC